MIIAVPREIAAGERRIALVPQAAGKLVKKGVEVRVETGAGVAAGFSDDDYSAQDVRIWESVDHLLGEADVVLKVQPPCWDEGRGRHEVDAIREGATIISFLGATTNPELAGRLRDRKLTSFAMELMPRITRAQSMDALSSMSSIAGYKAVLIAASRLPKYFPMLVTAAGTITPARVLVLGAGVAGLQAIATARRLGAVVEAFDVRPVVKEQVESLGARFVEIAAQTAEAQDAGGYAREQAEDTQGRIRQGLEPYIARADVVITTALIPGKSAPLLVTGSMVERMRTGSVIVDLAAEQGGNCEPSRSGEVIEHHGVTVFGPTNLPADMPLHASELYARNISAFLEHLLDGEGALHLDLEDELTKGPLVTRDGEILHDLVKAAVEKPESGGQ